MTGTETISCDVPAELAKRLSAVRGYVDTAGVITAALSSALERAEKEADADRIFGRLLLTRPQVLRHLAEWHALWTSHTPTGRPSESEEWSIIEKMEEELYEVLPFSARTERHDRVLNRLERLAEGMWGPLPTPPRQTRSLRE